MNDKLTNLWNYIKSSFILDHNPNPNRFVFFSPIWPNNWRCSSLTFRCCRLGCLIVGFESRPQTTSTAQKDCNTYASKHEYCVIQMEYRISNLSISSVGSCCPCISTPINHSTTYMESKGLQTQLLYNQYSHSCIIMVTLSHNCVIMVTMVNQAFCFPCCFQFGTDLVA